MHILRFPWNHFHVPMNSACARTHTLLQFSQHLMCLLFSLFLFHFVAHFVGSCSPVWCNHACMPAESNLDQCQNVNVMVCTFQFSLAFLKMSTKCQITDHPTIHSSIHLTRNDQPTAPNWIEPNQQLYTLAIVICSFFIAFCCCLLFLFLLLFLLAQLLLRLYIINTVYFFSISSLVLLFLFLSLFSIPFFMFAVLPPLRSRHLCTVRVSLLLRFVCLLPGLFHCLTRWLDGWLVDWTVLYCDVTNNSNTQTIDCV